MRSEANDRAAQVLAEAEWIASKLVEAREALKDAPLVVNYLDTNGNERQKSNPAYDAYVSLLNAFLKAIRALEDLPMDTNSGETEVTLDSIRVLVNPLKAAL